MTDTSTATVIASFAKNRNETCTVRLDTYRGVHCMDVRLFADFDGTGESRPTKKGLALRVDLIPQLIAALQDAEAEARRRGMFKEGAE